MSSPFGRMAARVSPTTRRRILLGTLVASIVVYELDAVADDDSVRGDSISETNRWLYGLVERLVGEAAAQLLWNCGVGGAANWYAGHILKPTLPDVTN